MSTTVCPRGPRLAPRLATHLKSFLERVWHGGIYCSLCFSSTRDSAGGALACDAAPRRAYDLVTAALLLLQQQTTTPPPASENAAASKGADANVETAELEQQNNDEKLSATHLPGPLFSITCNEKKMKVSIAVKTFGG